LKNIIAFALICLAIIGCGQTKEEKSDTSPIASSLESVNKSAQEVVSSIGEGVSAGIQKVGEISGELSQKADNITQNAIQQANDITQSVSQVANDAKEASVNAAKEALQKANETLNEASKNINEAAGKAAQKSKNIAEAAAAPLSDAQNGKKVFGKCIPCHGAKANLKALNNSQDISKWSKENIVNSLKGYKNGTYGGKMKVSMTPIVKPLSDNDMNDVADYIQNLGK
jgi:cytochrome c